MHQIRNSLKYVSSKDVKILMSDLKKIYQASSKEIAENYLLELDEKWERKYPLVVKSLQNNWENLSGYFNYSSPVRKLIYTTNQIEGLHRQIRKFKKNQRLIYQYKCLVQTGIFCYKKGRVKLDYPYT